MNIKLFKSKTCLISSQLSSFLSWRRSCDVTESSRTATHCEVSSLRIRFITSVLKLFLMLWLLVQAPRITSWSHGPEIRLWGYGGWILSCRGSVFRETSSWTCCPHVVLMIVVVVVVVQLCVSDVVDDQMEDMSLTVESEKSLSSVEPESQHSVAAAAGNLQGETTRRSLTRLFNESDQSSLLYHSPTFRTTAPPCVQQTSHCENMNQTMNQISLITRGTWMCVLRLGRLSGLRSSSGLGAGFRSPSDAAAGVLSGQPADQERQRGGETQHLTDFVVQSVNSEVWFKPLIVSILDSISIWTPADSSYLTSHSNELHVRALGWSQSGTWCDQTETFIFFCGRWTRWTAAVWCRLTSAAIRFTWWWSFPPSIPTTLPQPSSSSRRPPSPPPWGPRSRRFLNAPQHTLNVGMWWWLHVCY